MVEVFQLKLGVSCSLILGVNCWYHWIAEDERKLLMGSIQMNDAGIGHRDLENNSPAASFLEAFPADSGRF